jgi:hypothetical protein
VACGYCAIFIALKARVSTQAAVSQAASSSSKPGCTAPGLPTIGSQVSYTSSLRPRCLPQVLVVGADRYAVACVLAGFIGWLMSITRKQYIEEIARILELPISGGQN